MLLFPVLAFTLNELKVSDFTPSLNRAPVSFSDATVTYFSMIKTGGVKKKKVKSILVTKGGSGGKEDHRRPPAALSC